MNEETRITVTLSKAEACKLARVARFRKMSPANVLRSMIEMAPDSGWTPPHKASPVPPDAPIVGAMCNRRDPEPVAPSTEAITTVVAEMTGGAVGREWFCEKCGCGIVPGRRHCGQCGDRKRELEREQFRLYLVSEGIGGEG